MSALQVISAGAWPWNGDPPSRKALVCDPGMGLRIEVERYTSNSRLRIKANDSWQEAFVLPLESTGRASDASYVRLEPDSEWHRGPGKACALLRCTYSGSFLTQGGFEDSPLLQANPFSTVSADLPWKEVPQRLPGNAPARTSKLFRTPSKRFISTLIDAEPGWVLEEHVHSTDVASICIAGGGTLTAGKNSWRREPLQVALITAGASHGFVAGPIGVTIFMLVFPTGTLRS